ncbi:hypothetical protein FHX37_0786 [Haloactinospora alba]|uniref:Uncharacterized protein n=1 Tax=Haloactinospora alba TaxID=405555 RepID=A0A543NGC3_9ACTN|nr:hypothetical protein [Haloactinospora alba]TQN30898.1 hypothetical protein FHX37_0786 [Haloactinospora alba]
MSSKNDDLDALVRAELGDEPSQEAKDYARELYEKYRLPATAPVEPEAAADDSGSAESSGSESDT